MKRTTFFNLFILGLVLVFGVTACKKKPKGLTTIPNNGMVGNPNNRQGLENTTPIPFDPNDPKYTIAPPHPEDWENRPKDREKFAANTVHFDLDSSTVKSSESSKLEAVANYFKSNPAGDLLIEGHCDERGTEGYNLSLGDKRASALREYLVNLGVSPDRIHTLSLGEAQPAATGQDESAWSKNRRGEFIFVEPAK
ncbi:MAG: OmpA family protein [Verrucomicrobiota bacterium]